MDIFAFCDEAVIKLGLDPIKVMEYTPYELVLLGKQKEYKNQEEFEKDLVLAWHTEAFARQKRLPHLNRIIKDSRKKKVLSKSDLILKKMAEEKGVIIK